MGNADTKLNFRKAVVQLTTKTQVRVTRVRRCEETSRSPVRSVQFDVCTGNIFDVLTVDCHTVTHCDCLFCCESATGFLV